MEEGRKEKERERKKERKMDTKLDCELRMRESLAEYRRNIIGAITLGTWDVAWPAVGCVSLIFE